MADTFCGLVGGHASMRQLYATIQNVSRLGPQTSILIQGESGTGKELVARAIHELSERRDAPFVAVNCGAFTRSLLEDQLFGHERGAFTGATGARDGVFVAAGEGTLFLDEITEMEPELQARLLRVIQEREVFPLGADAPRSFRAGLITATNRPISEEVERGRFRRDLYYRINVIHIEVPPLRHRSADIPLLVDHFLDEFGGTRAQRPQLAAETLVALCRYGYPGNVRELRNAVESACALGRGAKLEPADLPPEFRDGSSPGFPTLAAVERQHIVEALRLARGKKVLAARFLDVDRNRLYRMIRRHRIQSTEYTVARSPELSPEMS